MTNKVTICRNGDVLVPVFLASPSGNRSAGCLHKAPDGLSWDFFPTGLGKSLGFRRHSFWPKYLAREQFNRWLEEM